MSQAANDFQAFRQALGNDVRPLKSGGKATVNRQRQTPSDAQLARRESAQRAGEDERDFLSDEFVDLVGAHDPIEYRRDGIQIGVLERLRQGGYEAEARLHIMRLPVIDCRREVFRFLREAYEHDLRSVMIVHGRSAEDDGKANVVRSYLFHWLMQIEPVQAFSSAPTQQGGLGATYVMLRKSERARARNRERQQKRRG
ncbi:DNA endonuclease SmrA [Salinicola avicenniae]|uniref:DNA endonuclease SmrA n=1 Tax=Salinicola avicenniae TaxID=2916836 RepID=UPI0020730571|nr:MULTISPECIES: DNA endonuclease SmrA [unclassified Salinicola]